MPSNNRPFEYVRTRPRKDRDKDRDSDTHSQAGTTISSLRERKHRKSHGSSTQSDGASTIKCNTESIDDLPPLPETEESEPASSGTSPIMRTSSSISMPTQHSMPGSFDTPENLQPYLEESEEDTMSTINVPNRMAESGEWIGPRVESEPPFNAEHDDNMPTPKPKRDPLDSPHISKDVTKTDDKDGPIEPAGSTNSWRKPQQSFIDNDMIYSWAAGDSQKGKFYYPSQMPNPFVPPAAKAGQSTTPPQSLPSKKSSPSVPKSSVVAVDPPKLGQGTPPTRLSHPRQVPETAPRENFHEHYHVARIERPPQAPPEHQPSESGLPPALQPGMMIPVTPSYSPVPMHQTHSNPLPYPGIPTRMDHPTNILHRVGNVLPDIAALIDMYYGACHILNLRDQHIRDIEAQKAAESDRQKQRIDSLTKDIQSMIRHHENEEKKLQKDLEHVEKKFRKSQESYTRETQRRNEALSAHAVLQELHDNTKRKHEEDNENLHKMQELEKQRMVVIHESERQGLLDQLAYEAKAAEEALASLEQKHVSERQNQDIRWQRYTRELEEKHRQSETELSHTVNSQQEMLEEERRKHAESRNTYSKEREEMMRQWAAEKASMQTEAEEQRQSYLAKHRKSIEDLQQQSNETIGRLRTEFDGKISKLQREKAECQHQLDQTLAFHESEIRSASETFRKEKEEYTKAMESSSQQRINELQDTIRYLQKDDSPKSSGRDSSESRRLLEAQNTVIQLQKQNEELLRSRGPSQSRLNGETQDIIAQLQKENEVLKADRLRSTKPKTEDVSHSRSTTPAPKEEKLERTRSNRASGIFTVGGSSRRDKGEEGHRHHRLS